MAFLEHLLIIVRQLFSGVHFTNGLDPDPSVVHYRITVWITRVIDQARSVTADASVYHNCVVDREQKCVMSDWRTAGAVRVAAVRLGHGDAFAPVFDQPSTRGDEHHCEYPSPMNG